MSSSDSIGPDPLLSGGRELWFVIYDQVTGAITDHGNAFGQAEYDAATRGFANPNLLVPGRLLSITGVRVDPSTLEIVPVEPETAPIV
jgi:hypothetical protein